MIENVEATINEHIIEEQELDKNAVIRKFRTTAKDYLEIMNIELKEIDKIS